MRETVSPSTLPTQQKVVKYLQKKVMSTAPGGRLPTVRQIGETCGVSSVTVQTVVQRLCEDGLIESRPRKGLFKRASMLHAQDMVGHIDVLILYRLDKRISAGSHHAELINAISLVCGERMQTTRLTRLASFPREADVEEIATRGDCQACIVIGAHDDRVNEVLRRHHVNYVNLFPAGPLLLDPVVAIDNEALVQMQMNYLLERGHRRIGLIHQIDPHIFHRDLSMRREVYHRTIAELGLPFEAEWCQPGGYERENMIKAVRRIVELAERPTALLVPDGTLVAVYQTLYQHGLVPGRDIAVMGLDDLPVSEMVIPPATSLRIDLPASARMALEKLDKIVTGQPIEPIDWVPLSIVERESIHRIDADEAQTKPIHDAHSDAVVASTH